MGDKAQITVGDNVSLQASPVKLHMLRQYGDFFKNKIIVVTGARQGIGRELVKLFHAEGSKVYAISRFVEHLKTLQQRYPGVTPIAANLKSWKDTEEAIEDMLEGPVDLLVNNAEEMQREDFLHSTEYCVNRVFDINVKGMLAVSRAIAKKMIEGGRGGSIVNVSSLASTNPSLATGLFAYCSSKAAADMITRSMAIELGDHNIRVNSVNPTIVTNDFRKEFWIGTDTGKRETEQLASLTPLKKFAEMDDVIQAVLFLLSDKSAMTTGMALKIDGGYSAR